MVLQRAYFIILFHFTSQMSSLICICFPAVQIRFWYLCKGILGSQGACSSVISSSMFLFWKQDPLWSAGQCHDPNKANALSQGGLAATAAAQIFRCDLYSFLQAVSVRQNIISLQKRLTLWQTPSVGTDNYMTNLHGPFTVWKRLDPL